MNTTSNPLLADPDSVGFDTIRAEHLAPALDVLLADAQAALEYSVSDAVPADYDAMARALDVPVERLTVAWGRANHLHAVADTPELRAAVADNLPRVTQFFTSLASDERLYAKYKQMVAARVGQPAASAQDKVRAKVLAERQLDFEDARFVFESTNFETEDTRKDYGERRILCFGMLRDRMVVIGYTPRGADRHVFSMRKANDREQARITPLLGV